MFWEGYFKCFSVLVKIIAYNAIVIFCHLIEFAIFSISDFFSLFSIAVFNIPISHIIVVLLFLLQSYCFFRYFQTFFNFFHFFRLDLPIIANFVFMLCRCSSLFRWCSVGVLSCVLMTIYTQSYTRAYIRAYIRARTGIFR